MKNRLFGSILYYRESSMPARSIMQNLWPFKLLLWPMLFLVFGPVFAQNGNDIFPKKPEPAVYVHDYAGWLSPEEKTSLEQKLIRYYDSTSTQIVVMIRPDIGDYDKSSYAFELGKQWGIGQKGKNNGIVMLVKTQQPQRGVFIATGYGTEGALPDFLAGRIIREVIGPYFRQEQYYEGINAGLDNIIAALSGEFKREDAEAEDFPVGFFILFFLLVIGFIFFMAWRSRNSTVYGHEDGGYRRRTIHRDPNVGGGWWIGGGGWGGGNSGGSSGWGGGSDGGSFGGGDFGGGGAGGDW